MKKSIILLLIVIFVIYVFIMCAPMDPGDSGDSGNSGDGGDSGNSGDGGDSGNSGDTGNTGDTGDTGNTGDTGDTGNTGDTGDTGNTGDTGGEPAIDFTLTNHDGTDVTLSNFTNAGDYVHIEFGSDSCGQSHQQAELLTDVALELQTEYNVSNFISLVILVGNPEEQTIVNWSNNYNLDYVLEDINNSVYWDYDTIGNFGGYVPGNIIINPDFEVLYYWLGGITTSSEFINELQINVPQMFQ